MQVLQLAQRCAALEREVSEARQLREEEDALLAGTVAAMGRVWQQMLQVRACARSGATRRWRFF